MPFINLVFIIMFIAMGIDCGKIWKNIDLVHCCS